MAIFPPTDWGDWTPEEYEVGAPATALHFERWFRNVVAAFQGSLGAPRLNPIANDTPWVAAGLLTGSNYTAFTGLEPRVASIRVVVMLAANSTSTNFQVGFSTDNGATWDSSQALSSVGGGQGLILDAHINLVTGVVASAGVIPSDGGIASGAPVLATSLTIPGGANAVRFRTVAGRMGRIYVEVTGGIP